MHTNMSNNKTCFSFQTPVFRVKLTNCRWHLENFFKNKLKIVNGSFFKPNLN